MKVSWAYVVRDLIVVLAILVVAHSVSEYIDAQTDVLYVQAMNVAEMDDTCEWADYVDDYVKCDWENRPK